MLAEKRPTGRWRQRLRERALAASDTGLYDAIVNAEAAEWEAAKGYGRSLIWR